MVDTCGNGDDSTYQRTSDGGGCPTATRANGPDLVYAITLATRSTITLDLRDDDGVPIDTVLYLRTHCDEMASQVACSDDLPCGMTDFGCGGGSTSRLEVRQSRITITLEPGTYYVIADSFEYDSGGTRFTCGDVLLRYDVVATSVMP
jgi:hypothetical protein